MTPEKKAELLLKFASLRGETADKISGTIFDEIGTDPELSKDDIQELVDDLVQPKPAATVENLVETLTPREGQPAPIAGADQPVETKAENAGNDQPPADPPDTPILEEVRQDPPLEQTGGSQAPAEVIQDNANLAEKVDLNKTFEEWIVEPIYEDRDGIRTLVDMKKIEMIRETKITQERADLQNQNAEMSRIGFFPSVKD
jgi:hypothetical protein